MIIASGALFTEYEGLSAMSATGCQWALDELWRRVARGAEWEGPPLIRLPLLTAEEFRTRIDVPTCAMVRTDELGIPLDDRIARSVPMPFGVEQAYHIASGGASVDFPYDLVSLTYFSLSRLEEWKSLNTDDKGRYRSEASLAARLGYLERPVVDEWADVLRRCIEARGHKWSNHGERNMKLFATHDMDRLLRYWGADLPLQVLAPMRRRDIPGTLERARAALRSRADWRADPLHVGTTRLMESAEAFSLDSAFFFMTARPSRQDVGYDLALPPSKQILAEIRDRGHSIGFHAGYHTLDSPKLFAEEAGRFFEAVGDGSFGGRQHHLRFRVPETWRMWEASGFAYDSTLAYADRPGFRASTAFPFQVFDVERDRRMDLEEIPLIVMEVSLLSSRYMGLSHPDALSLVKTLAKRCANVGGVFTYLWHNTSFDGAAADRRDFYDPMLQTLLEIQHG